MASSSSPKARDSHGSTLRDLRSASVAVLRMTARDVFRSKEVDFENNLNPEDSGVPKFDARDLTIGRVLGRGSFCVVH
jgi:hypothetical protein